MEPSTDSYVGYCNGRMWTPLEDNPGQQVLFWVVPQIGFECFS